MREDKTYDILTDMEEIHFLELPKMKKFSKKSPITWWLEYLKNPHSEAVERIGEFEPTIKEAVEMFDVITADEETQELLRMREKGERDFNSAMKNSEIRGIVKGRKEGIEKGIEKGVVKGRAEGIEKGVVKGRKEGKKEGRKEEKIETALSMLADDVPISTISKYTGLSTTEIKALKLY
jgi:predicted transposase/invertase (TIGR01784 family)